MTKGKKEDKNVQNDILNIPKNELRSGDREAIQRVNRAMKEMKKCEKELDELENQIKMDKTQFLNDSNKIFGIFYNRKL